LCYEVDLLGHFRPGFLPSLSGRGSRRLKCRSHYVSHYRLLPQGSQALFSFFLNYFRGNKIYNSPTLGVRETT
jgi:hypothetical protein